MSRVKINTLLVGLWILVATATTSVSIGVWRGTLETMPTHAFYYPSKTTVSAGIVDEIDSIDRELSIAPVSDPSNAFGGLWKTAITNPSIVELVANPPLPSGWHLTIANISTFDSKATPSQIGVAFLSWMKNHKAEASNILTAKSVAINMAYLPITVAYDPWDNYGNTERMGSIRLAIFYKN